MYLNLEGDWTVTLTTKEGTQKGKVSLPGIIQAQGYGEKITKQTPWVSSLHDAEWWEREEYRYAQEDGCRIPFLSQPPRHFLGKVLYEREIEIKEEDSDTWYLYIEVTHWRTKVSVDGMQTGEDCSVCTAHRLDCGRLTRGIHTIQVEVDNSMQYPYRPDGHGVSDALGATWNGMAGEIALFTQDVWEKRIRDRKQYAKEHIRRIRIENGRFIVDGRKEYFRGTHFGGEYPLTGYPVTDKAWWRDKFAIMKKWGLNFMRCHSYCPPEAAFAAADEMGIYLQPECGMWNHFEENIPMLDVLKEETRRILEQFGHHPSFVLFSPTNEPSGNWYGVLRKWVEETREYDRYLGYENRRVYTAQSGWFYDTAPSQVEGTDYLYFHRSAYGPYLGGSIRGPVGWRGGNYTPSLEQADKPVICHELGQWCAYPDFHIIDSFSGYLIPGNYQVFREHCKAQGLLGLNREFAYASGRNQVRLYKEDIEANLRTQQLDGFELLDIHDYLGQGTACVGVLDAFWQEKGYVDASEFRQFCSDVVILAAFPRYVYTVEDTIQAPVMVCNFGEKDIDTCVIKWKLYARGEGEWNQVVMQGRFPECNINQGEKALIGDLELNQKVISEYASEHGNQCFLLELYIHDVTFNTWKIYVYGKMEEEDCFGENNFEEVCYTQEWQQAKSVLEQGGRVIYAPFLSDLSYECPPLSMRNVFWNGQMGPAWGRELGMIADTECRIFDDFPTDVDGGWQWEDILQHARGFHLQKSLRALTPIVRIIDDWNRNLPLALMLEAKVGQGRLLLVSADLSGDFKDRPAAYCLRQSLLRYAHSTSFAPQMDIRIEDVEESLFPVLRMQTLVGENAKDNSLIVENPQISAVYEEEQFPIEIEIPLCKTIAAEGILYVPDQRERKRAEFPKDVEVYIKAKAENEWKRVCKCEFHNSSLSQRIYFDKQYEITAVRLLVISCWGADTLEEWQEYKEGYRKVSHLRRPVVRLAGIHLLCQEEAPHNNEIFWQGQHKSATKEIEA